MPRKNLRGLQGNQGQFDELFKANGDLSSHQYKFVYLAASPNEVALATGASNPTPIGVLQNAPTASQPAVVRVFGRTSLVGSDIGFGHYFTATGAGVATKPTATGCAILGRWLSASQTGSGSGTALINTLTGPTACAAS